MSMSPQHHRKELHLATEWVDVVITLLAHLPEVLGSNIDRVFMVFSVPPGKCRNVT
jgi:hypothetical protein